MLDTDYLNRLSRAGFDPAFPNASYLFHDVELEYLRAQWESDPLGQWRNDAGWVYQDSESTPVVPFSIAAPVRDSDS